MAMNDALPLARIANAAHMQRWRITAAEADVRPDGGIIVTLHGGFAAKLPQEIGYLWRYLSEAGDISVKLHRLEERQDCTIVGELVEAVEASYSEPRAREFLVERFTATLGGFPFPEAQPRPYADRTEEPDERL